MTAAGLLAHRGSAMAFGTMASRATGFLRTAIVLAAVGTTGVGDAYNVANTTPNIVYDLLLGGVLSSVVIPLLVRAAREDDDGGEGFTSTLFTVVVVALGVATVVGELGAPVLMRLYLHGNVSLHERALAVTFTRLLLPQLLFYALTALAGAVLNIRGRFGVVGVAPVVNNLVVIAVALVFLATAHHRHLFDRLSGGQTLLLGLGTTAGVVAMSAALLPSLRRAGVRLRWRLDIRNPRLRVAARLGGWVLGYAVANQLGYLVITNLATARPGGYTVYSTAYQIFSLPYAIVAVSVISVLMPGLSSAAADNSPNAIRAQLSRGLRLSTVLLVPAALLLVALAYPISAGAFHYGASGAASARLIADTLAMFALGLPAFCAYQLLLRVCYAGQDSRTPALINVAVNAVNVGADLIAVAVLPAHLRIPGLAAGFTLSYVAGAAVAARVLHHRTSGGIDGRRVMRVLVRVTLATVVAAVVARTVADLVAAAVGTGAEASILVTLVAALPAGLTYVGLARRMRVRELSGLGAVLRRTPRSESRPG